MNARRPLARAMLAGAIKRQLMRSNLEARVRKPGRRDLVFGLYQDIEYLAALFTDEMLMALDERIETLRSPQHQHLKLFVRDQLLQIAVNGPEADVGQTLPHFVIDLVGGRMGIIVFDGVPHNFQLFCIPGFLL